MNDKEINNSKLKKLILSWHMTNKCDQKCRYCFADTRPDVLTEKDHYKIANKLQNDQIDEVAVAGGEILLLPHILEIIKYLYDSGLLVGLNTNGSKTEMLEKVIPYLDYVTLPFDFANNELANEIRGTKNIDFTSRILSNIEMVKKNSDAKINIGTCVNKYNLDSLEQIGKTLNDQGIDTWQLRRFFPVQGRAKKNNSEEQFNTVTSKMKNTFSQMNITTRNHSEFENMYLMLSAFAELFRAKDGQNIVLANLLKDNVSIRKIAEQEHMQERI